MALLSCGGKKESSDQAAAEVASAQPSSAVSADYLISCEGIGKVKMSANFADLTNTLGTAVSDIQDGMDGDFSNVTLGENAEVTVTFDYQHEKGQRILSLSTYSQTFQTAKGLRAGLSLSEAEKLAGQPLECHFNGEVMVVYCVLPDATCAIGYLATAAQSDQPLLTLIQAAFGTQDGKFLSNDPKVAALALEISGIEVTKR